MLVYGDLVRRLRAGEALDEVRVDLARAAEGDAAARHAALVSALIGLGELAQGLADADFAARGCDSVTPMQDACATALLAVARAVDASWRGAAVAPPDIVLPPLPDATLELRRPEGYAFYALYPEAYAEAARPLAPWPDGVVLGLRSIGTSLGAMVAAALDAPPPLTARPVGHPFDRRLALSPGLSAALRTARRAAVVDEGPGLSGSSFAAALDALHGVATEVFPGHGGDLGPQAGPERRERWARTSRRVVDFDTLMLRSGRLQAYAEALVGTAESPLEDISGGGWRTRRDPDEAGWPAANTHQERRKFLLQTADGPWLLKFAGLGRIGEHKLARARALHAEGFTTQPAGLAHGFLVERWISPGGPAAEPPLAAYLAARAGFAAPPEAGAPLRTLLEMAGVNTAESLGEDAAAALQALVPRSPLLEARVRRVETDNRMHAWEWITTPDGRLLKTDAVDHHAAHDLVGAQDIAWDVAGAEAEFDLDADALERLRRAAGADAELLVFLRPCYLAFQLGYYAMAADAHGGWPAEQARLRRERDRYRARLKALLAAL